MTDTLQMTCVLDAANVRETSDGYLTAMVRCARTGIQLYRGYEVGEPNRKSVRVYRPEEEVFNTDSLHTYAHRPITNDHPPVPVNSETWKKYSAGQTGEQVARDGQFVVVPMVLMDQSVIKDYQRGKKQLSLGYSCDLVWDAGVTPDGEEYDAVQRNIRANHLAVVAVARGGSELKIGDDEEEGVAMTMKAMTVDGIAVEMPDIAVQVVDRAIKARDTQVAMMTADLKTAQDALAKAIADATSAATAAKSAIETKDAENKTLSKQLEDAKITPQKLDAMVADRSAVVGIAKKILGDKLVVDGKTISDIRRQCVDSYLGNDAKDFTDDQVFSAFNMMAKDAKPVSSGNGRDVLADAISQHSGVQDTRDSAYNEYEKKLVDAWKKPSAAA